MGRPSDYSLETASAICARLADGESLTAICRDEGMPHRATVFRWLEAHPDFRDNYVRARERQAHVMAEMAVEDAVKATDAQLGRLAYDARKWFAGRLLPKVYGEKYINEHTGADGGPIQVVTGVPRAAD